MYGLRSQYAISTVYGRILDHICRYCDPHCIDIIKHKTHVGRFTPMSQLCSILSPQFQIANGVPIPLKKVVSRSNFYVRLGMTKLFSCTILDTTSCISTSLGLSRGGVSPKALFCVLHPYTLHTENTNFRKPIIRSNS